MELGQRLKQARLEAGLSQRQLCGTEITRNMLSLIENGSAKPSMDTLQYLAAQLGKPVSYFLEEEAVTSPNQQLMAQARAAYARGEDALEQLNGYTQPDAIFDAEYHLLAALGRMRRAKTALAENKNAYAWSLLCEAATHGKQTAYYGLEQERTRLLLCYRARPDLANDLAEQLPYAPEEVFLRAQTAPTAQQAGQILDATPMDDPHWHRLRADAYYREENFARALTHYEKAHPDRQTYEQMELCCKALEDFKGAYYYAVKAREL